MSLSVLLSAKIKIITCTQFQYYHFYKYIFVMSISVTMSYGNVLYVDSSSSSLLFFCYFLYKYWQIISVFSFVTQQQWLFKMAISLMVHYVQFKSFQNDWIHPRNIAHDAKPKLDFSTNLGKGISGLNSHLICQTHVIKCPCVSKD